MTEREVILDVKNMTKRFGDLLVLDDVSFDVKKGEFLCIVGPTGCGKTTFLNCLTDIYQITEGQILLHGKEIDLEEDNLAYILQEYSAFPWLTVEENVRFGLEIKRYPKEEISDMVDDALKMVNLEDYRDYYPRQLSASMLQRVVIARAFVTNPELLLMDEPYGQLDIELRFQLEDELLNIWREKGTTVIFITHNIEEAVYMAERILVLSNKPTTIKEEIFCDLPHPRDVTAPEFVKIRQEVTDLIKWW